MRSVETDDGKLKRIDFLGSGLLSATIICFLLVLDLGGQKMPWSSPVVLVLAGLAVAFGLLFLLVEGYWAREPVFPLRLLIHRDVITAYLIAGLQIAAQFGVSPGLSFMRANRNSYASSGHLTDSNVKIVDVFSSIIFPSFCECVSDERRHTPSTSSHWKRSRWAYRWQLHKKVCRILNILFCPKLIYANTVKDGPLPTTDHFSSSSSFSGISTPDTALARPYQRVRIPVHYPRWFRNRCRALHDLHRPDCRCRSL